ILETRPDIEVVAINDLYSAEALAYLLKYDTVMGTFEKSVSFDQKGLLVDGRSVALSAVKDPAQIPWKDLGVQIVVESTGVFANRAALEKHLAAGAERVLLTVPPKDEIDRMVVIGVNDDLLTKDDRIVSNASCTTNCLAPLAKVLHETFGIEHGI